MINITEAAQEYLAELLAKQDVKDIAVRIFILDQVLLEQKRVYLSVGRERKKLMMK